MKNFLVILVLAVFMAGCGGKKETSSSEIASSGSKKDYIAEGMKYLKEKDLERAIRSFDLAIKQDPTNTNNFLFLGQIYLRLKQNDKAADTFDAATKIDPSNGQAYFFLAVSRALQQRKEEAIKSAQRAADLFMQSRNEEMFKQSIALVKGLSEGTAVDAVKDAGMVSEGMSGEVAAPKM